MIKNRKDFPKLLYTHNCKVGLELGVSRGGFSYYLNTHHTFEKFYGIDSWNSRGRNATQYISAIRKLKKFTNVEVYRGLFEEMLSIFPDEYFDFIYIDGYAHLGNISKDTNQNTIEQWYCKVAPGGIYSGHDYCSKFPLNVATVDSFCKEINKQLNVTIETDSEEPSWWVIK